ncbi:MAG: NAD(P)-binding domain-containing protein [Coxiellaceae bacterium]|nr:NAD(P)-binding domain-containing protein [Coxiellaceae bacterium]
MTTTTFDWAIIGAGPAGIATVGKLLDAGVNPSKIIWFDPHFTLGDFGSKWYNVPSNTKVALFKQFLRSCQSFDFDRLNHSATLFTLPDTDTCELNIVADVLQQVSNHLAAKVTTQHTMIDTIKHLNPDWQLSSSEGTVTASNVVLAVGAEPISFDYPTLTVIPLEIAVNHDAIPHHCHADDVIAVFGSSHSAILAMKNIIERTPVNKIINFYLEPLRFAVDKGDYILYDDTGLKGTTATWAKESFDQFIPEKIERYYSDQNAIATQLARCNKAIYAVGFQRREIPSEPAIHYQDYSNQTGIIRQGLYGIGIAFPELKTNREGISEYRVGLWKFMDYLHRVMPLWLENA